MLTRCLRMRLFPESLSLLSTILRGQMSVSHGYPTLAEAEKPVPASFGLPCDKVSLNLKIVVSEQLITRSNLHRKKIPKLIFHACLKQHFGLHKRNPSVCLTLVCLWVNDVMSFLYWFFFTAVADRAKTGIKRFNICLQNLKMKFYCTNCILK